MSKRGYAVQLFKQVKVSRRGQALRSCFPRVVAPVERLLEVRTVGLLSAIEMTDKLGKWLDNLSEAELAALSKAVHR